MTDEEDPLEPPAWADDDSFLAGVAAAMDMIASTAGEYRDLVGMSLGEGDEDSDEGECPDCGRDLVDAIGSADPICPACDV